MVGELLIISLVISIPFAVHAGFFANIFNNPASDEIATTQISSVSASDIPLLAALQNPDPMAARGGAEIIVEDNTLISSGPIGADEIAQQKSNLGEIRVYTVREGDSLSQVAE